MNILLGKRTQIHVDGVCVGKFQAVYDVFKNNFDQGLEREGAAFALYYNGQLVVDAWGGYMDRELGRKWEKDTVTIAMSCTKAVAALTLAMMADKGLLDYDAPVTKYWPEFGQHGKQNITVKMLLSHQGGLCALDRRVSYDDVRDWRRMSKIFEDQKPFWNPGSAYGYHAITMGWLVDQLLRRTDPKQRSVGQFLKEEIAEPNGIDFQIGFRREEWHRLARRSEPGLSHLLSRYWDTGLISFLYGILFRSNKLLLQKTFSPFAERDFLISPESFEVEVPGVTGIGTARSLAKIFSLVEQQKLLSASLIERIAEPLNALDGAADCITGMPQLNGWGFTHNKCPTGDHYLFGHCGYGGSLARVDYKNKFAFAYLRNGLEIEHEQVFPARSVVALQDAIYSCLS